MFKRGKHIQLLSVPSRSTTYSKQNIREINVNLEGITKITLNNGIHV